MYGVENVGIDQVNTTYCLHGITSPLESAHNRLQQGLSVEDFTELRLQLLEGDVGLALNAITEELVQWKVR